MNEWIPVTKRMPKEHQDVIAYAGGIQLGAAWAYDQWWTREGMEWDKVYAFPVTHWQPLFWPPEA